MSATNIMQIENYRKVGIRPLHMYVAFANHYGGYDKVGFIRKDIYNQEVHMRKQHTSYASGALKYLHDLRTKDPMMYVSCTADEGSRLQRLFWCDAERQLLYENFAVNIGAAGFWLFAEKCLCVVGCGKSSAE
ncbi:hypothetical protein JHK87_010114 [Glycine soja]|nr:hypothetical protein JHK87_010114 [Glycine soja]